MSKKRNLKLLLATIAGTIFLCIATYIVFVGAVIGVGVTVMHIITEYMVDGCWSNRLLCSKASPDGKYNINMYLKDGGALTDFQLRGELVNNETLESEYIYYEEGTCDVFCQWVNEKQLLINGYTTNVEGYLQGDYDWVINRELWDREFEKNKDENTDYGQTLKKVKVYEYDSSTGEKGSYLFQLDRDIYYDMEANAKINLGKDNFKPQYLMELYYKNDGEEKLHIEEIIMAVDEDGADFCVRTISDYVYRYRNRDVRDFLKEMNGYTVMTEK